MTHHRDLFRSTIPKPEQVKHLICFLPGKTREVLTLTAGIHALREYYNYAHIMAITSKDGLKTLSNNPFINEIITLDENDTAQQLKTLFLLSQQKTDLFIDLFTPASQLSSSIWHTIYARGFLRRLINSKQTIGFDIDPKKINKGHHINTLATKPNSILKSFILATSRLFPVKNFTLPLPYTNKLCDLNEHRTHTCLRLLFTTAQLPIAHHLFNNFYTPDQEDLNNQALIDENKKGFTACLFTGGYASVDKWPREKASEFIDQFFIRYPGAILHLIGDDTEAETAEFLAKEHLSHITNKQLVNHVGVRSFSETAVLIDRANIVISTFGDPLYLADVLGTPLIALASSAYVGSVWQARQARMILLNVPVACSPCEQENCHQPISCMEQLSATTVIEAINSMRSDRLAIKANF